MNIPRRSLKPLVRHIYYSFNNQIDDRPLAGSVNRINTKDQPLAKNVNRRNDFGNSQMLDVKRIIKLCEEQILLEVFLLKEFDTNSFLNKIQSVATLAKRPGTEGEREASKTALMRLFDRAKEEARNMSRDDSAYFLKRVSAIIAQLSTPEPKETPKAERPRYTPPIYAVGNWVYIPKYREAAKIINISSRNMYEVLLDGISHSFAENEIRRATQEEVDAMAHRKRPEPKKDAWSVSELLQDQRGTSDKVWGIARNGGKAATFWGKRTGPFSAKDYTGNLVAALDLKYSKIKKGYIVCTDRTTLDLAVQLLKTAKNLP